MEKIKAVIVTFYHTEDENGGMEGEFKYWIKKYGLSTKIDFPQGDFDIYTNSKGVLGFVAGIGVNTATAAIMGLGMDPRFDLSKAYWLISGIGGANPRKMTIGTVAIAKYAIDADMKHVIDQREMPKNWKYGISPFGNTMSEFPLPVKDSFRTLMSLNPNLATWVFGKCKDLDLNSHRTNQDIELCKRFYKDKGAQELPRVMYGEILSGDNFWHGRILNNWAEEWVYYWTDGKGEFAIAACEDVGILTALTLLSKANRVDYDRIIATRSASNFVCQWEGASASQSLLEEDVLELTGMETALKSAYIVGSHIIKEIVSNWEIMEESIPD